MTNPWDVAIETHYEALKMYRDTEAAVREMSPNDRRRVGYDELKNEMRLDRLFLSMAETYSWIDPAREAVFRASASIPTDAPLDFTQLPGTGTGFWHFSPPLPISTITPDINIDGDKLVGIVWGVIAPEAGITPAFISHAYHGYDDVKPDLISKTRDKNAMLTMSAFVRDARDGHIAPSTRFFWRMGETLSEMLHRTGTEYDESYGPTGRFKHAGHTAGREHTLAAVAAIARFFLAGCVWLQQDIIVTEPQHIERHARKRYAKDRRLAVPPTLRIVALRHVKHGGPAAERVLSDAKREWSYQWTVIGHWRSQPYGPGLLARKTIYINPFLKGPEGKPLKPESKKVYVVMK